MASVEALGPQLHVQLKGVEENIILTGDEAAKFAAYLNSSDGRQGDTFAKSHNFERVPNRAPIRVIC